MAAGAGEGAGAAVARCCCCFEACCCDAFFFVDAARDGELPRRVLLDRRMAVPPPPAERSSTRLSLLDSLFLPPFCARSPKFGWGGSLRLGNLKKIVPRCVRRTREVQSPIFPHMGAHDGCNPRRVTVRVCGRGGGYPQYRVYTP